MLGALVGLGLGCALMRNPPRRRRRRARRRNPDSIVAALAAKVDAGSITLGDVVPLLTRARAIQLKGVSRYHLGNWRERAPSFDLAVGDDMVTYDRETKRLRVVLRSGLKNDRYEHVDAHEARVASAHGEKKLAAALIDKVSGIEGRWVSDHSGWWHFEHSNPRRRRNPVVSVKRSKDFKVIGTYDVALSDGTTVQISRDGGSGGGGWWYIEWPGLHFVDRFIGFTKAEALTNLDEKVARLRARRK